MNKNETTTTKGRRIEYSCPSTGLPVVELEAFTNLELNRGYFFNVKKIGPSILYVANVGNMAFSNIPAYYATLEKFRKAVGMEGPYVEIRDFSCLHGRTPVNQVQFQRDYILDHQEEIVGLIACNAPFWIKSMMAVGMKTYSPNIHFAMAGSYSHAIEHACAWLADQPPDRQRLQQTAILFKPEWSYKNSASGFEYKLGALIPGHLLFLKLKGAAQPLDMIPVRETLERFFADTDMEGKNYYKIADYSEYENTSVHTRSLYAQLIRTVDERFRSRSNATYVYGTTARTLVQMKLHSLFIRQPIIETASYEEAIDRYLASAPSPASPKRLVTEKDLLEINNLIGSLVWPEYNPSTTEATILSPNNPLFHLRDTVEVIRQDIQDLRAKDRQAVTDLNTILDSTPIGIIIFVRDSSKILFANSAASTMLKRPLSQLIATAYTSMLTPQQHEALNNGALPNHKEEVIEQMDGGSLAVLRSIQPIQYRNQHCMMDAFTDISELVQLKNRLRQTLRTTEQLNSVMSGREDRIIELKQEVNTLLTLLGKEQKYLKELKEAAPPPSYPGLAL
jgi:PAS domain-containing protein